MSESPRSTALQGLAQSASRRSFLGQGLVAAAVPAAIAVASSGADAAPSPAVPQLYNGWNRRNFAEIRNDENAHVTILQSAIVSLGGIPRPKPTFRGLSAPNATAFVSMAATFENLGVQAYFGVSGLIFNPAVLAVASSIAFVEAYHSGYINTLLNRSIVPNSATYASAATIGQVADEVDPYISSLNGGLPLVLTDVSFGPGPLPPSTSLDINLLNFALAMEFLEAEFYNINVSRFFQV